MVSLHCCSGPEGLPSLLHYRPAGEGLEGSPPLLLGRLSRSQCYHSHEPLGEGSALPPHSPPRTLLASRSGEGSLGESGLTVVEECSCWREPLSAATIPSGADLRAPILALPIRLMAAWYSLSMPILPFQVSSET